MRLVSGPAGCAFWHKGKTQRPEGFPLACQDGSIRRMYSIAGRRTGGQSAAQGEYSQDWGNGRGYSHAVVIARGQVRYPRQRSFMVFLHSDEELVHLLRSQQVWGRLRAGQVTDVLVPPRRGSDDRLFA